MNDEIIMKALIEEVVKAFFVGKTYYDQNGYQQSIPGQLENVVSTITNELNVDDICKKIIKKIDTKEVIEKAVNSVQNILYADSSYSSGKKLQDNIKNAIASEISKKIIADQTFADKIIEKIDLSQMEIHVELKRKTN